MAKTKIEWTNYTINPVKGLCPMACPYCYARRMYKRFKWNPEIRYEPDWDIPLYKMKPSKVFIGSTMELFGDWILPQTMSDIIHKISHLRQHTFIFLTKKPENLIKWSPFPENCWVGVSATDNYDFINRIGYLGLIKARVKFISFEPLLKWDTFLSELTERVELVNWIIIGQLTPPSKKTEPKIEWIKEIVHAADKAKIPVFIKDNLRPLLPSKEPFWTPVQWQENGITFTENRLRQELPKT
jgi:protein gp37